MKDKKLGLAGKQVSLRSGVKRKMTALFKAFLIEVSYNYCIMAKRELVTLVKRKRHYRLCIDDIKKVHTCVHKKRPPVPSFENET